MADERKAMAKRVELLGVWTGRVDDSPHVLLSLRLDENFFEVTNIALSASQARRLLDDLARRFEESDLLKGTQLPDPGLRRAYEQIVSEQQNHTEEEPPHE